jgi:hypothetical protein
MGGSMARYGKKHWVDEFDDMKAYRTGRKYRWHKLTVAVGRNKAVRDSAASNTKRRLQSES